MRSTWEIRGLDEARRRIAELERQIRKLKNSNAAPQVDRLAIECPVRTRSSEHATWQRRLEQGRARFQRMANMLSSAGQSFDKLKVMLKETEREWPIPPANEPENHRSETARRPQTHRVASADSLDGPFKLSSGERRILTALADGIGSNDHAAGRGGKRGGRIRRNSCSRRMPRSLMLNHGVKHD